MNGYASSGRDGLRDLWVDDWLEVVGLAESRRDWLKVMEVGEFPLSLSVWGGRVQLCPFQCGSFPRQFTLKLLSGGTCQLLQLSIHY